MIVTRSWLQEYIDLSDISNQELLGKLNSIGLEVDGSIEHKIPAKVVVGEVLECAKHPDADKLNVCKVNIGSEVVQIVCGASNVVDAKYVAVATVGSVLPGDFKIKKAKLRGVESLGMICSSTELGLPPLEDGIMILDDSIGELVVGKELNEYKKFADLVIEIGLTPNRGDCTSIHGVARDLAGAFGKEVERVEYKPQNRSKIGIARELHIESECEFDGILEYALLGFEEFKPTFLQKLRVAFCELGAKDDIDVALKYASHSSGVCLRAYDYDRLEKDENGRVNLTITKPSEYLLEVRNNKSMVSRVGVISNDEFTAKDSSKKVILEASYIDPEFVVEGVVGAKLDTDSFYYNTSRGSEPNIELGLTCAYEVFCKDNECVVTESTIKVGNKPQSRKVSINMSEINAIIGQEIPKGEIASILLLLGFSMNRAGDDSYGIDVPPYRHDVQNQFDIAEEIVRIYGIDNIEAKDLKFEEKNRINSVYSNYLQKRALTQRAISAGFYEAITYAFADKELLQKYGFETLDESLEIVNPIVKELNTLRTTILVNLLEAANRNVKYGKKRISLFEAGSVFNAKREESLKVAFLFSGELHRASVVNSAKAKMIDFDSFVAKINSVIGDFSLIETKPKSALEHPYIVADVIKDGVSVGRLFKLHPKVASDFDLSDTFMAEFDFDAILPKHINASSLSNFQAVNKDLSVLVDSGLSFYDVAKELGEYKQNSALLKDFYPLDIYSDESLGNKKSLTVRFTIQSDEKTLSDADIDGVMKDILTLLEDKFDATLR